MRYTERKPTKHKYLLCAKRPCRPQQIKKLPVYLTSDDVNKMSISQIHLEYLRLYEACVKLSNEVIENEIKNLKHQCL
jgi:hypothetical protein